jgi:dihydrofolate synthase/folylpolyglutamate synthase
MALNHYRAALRAIWERSAYDRGFVSNPFAGDAAADLGLRRTAALLDRLGRPQERYGIVHVAGSKGKGSTCAFISTILRCAGYRVGCYSSPHLHSYRERIAVDGEPVSEADFAALTERACSEAAALERERPDLGALTAFELTTAMALDHFAAAGCDLAVVEVGMGGLLDATNVVTPLVSVITALDLEHTQVLGKTLPEIAQQKAGIIKPGRPVAVSPQPPDALVVIEQIAAERGSPMLVGGRDWRWEGSWRSFTAIGPWGTLTDLRSGLIGAHQVENAATAIAAVSLLPASDYPVHPDAMRQGIAQARWPGRFEVVEGAPRLILDGAHTAGAARALAATLREESIAGVTLVLAVMRDKDPAAIVTPLLPFATRIIATATQSPRAMAVDAVIAALTPLGLPVTGAPDVGAALEIARLAAERSGTVLVTGSLTTVAEAREALGLATPDPAVEESGARG